LLALPGCSAWASPTLRPERLALRDLCQRRHHGHPPRAEQAVGARQDRVQDYMRGERGRGSDVAGIAGHSGGVTVLYQWLQRAALQRETHQIRAPHNNLTDHDS